jgi:hypothetical protein
LSRENNEGDLFYMMTETSQETRQLFKLQNVTWIGAIVGLFEPDYKSLLNQVPILKVDQPLLPLQASMTYKQTRPYVAEYEDRMVPKALFVQDATIAITKANILVGCGADLCDSQHEESTPCPAAVTQEIAKRVLSCRITSKEANISRVPFKSTQFFIHFKLILHKSTKIT